MRKPIGVTVPYRAPTPEDEAFNEIERRSKVKQTLIVHKSKEAMLMSKVIVLEALIRDLTDALRGQRTWVGLTDEEANKLWESTDSNDDWELMKRTEAKLRSKNENRMG